MIVFAVLPKRRFAEQTFATRIKITWGAENGSYRLNFKTPHLMISRPVLHESFRAGF
ncbi:MAG: hypothetical protein Pg6C_18970 [Treponemataceae bacterium]|nr:MAG: hypothetical protein Pg6C_18740 [Treponemataceae bacterium]GMO52973.1 MAG: hypothetical protein Pg6C_18970 [Treponemataceae bacterium]